jgi:hypothetical protein
MMKMKKTNLHRQLMIEINLLCQLSPHRKNPSNGVHHLPLLLSQSPTLPKIHPVHLIRKIGKRLRQSRNRLQFHPVDPLTKHPMLKSIHPHRNLRPIIIDEKKNRVENGIDVNGHEHPVEIGIDIVIDILRVAIVIDATIIIPRNVELVEIKMITIVDDDMMMIILDMEIIVDDIHRRHVIDTMIGAIVIEIVNEIDIEIVILTEIVVGTMIVVVIEVIVIVHRVIRMFVCLIWMHLRNRNPKKNRPVHRRVRVHPLVRRHVHPRPVLHQAIRPDRK